jgi:hypothetical protein
MLQDKFGIESDDGKKVYMASSIQLIISTKRGAYTRIAGRFEVINRFVESDGVTCCIASHFLLDGHPALNSPGTLTPHKKGTMESQEITMVERML